MRARIDEPAAFGVEMDVGSLLLDRAREHRVHEVDRRRLRRAAVEHVLERRRVDLLGVVVGLALADLDVDAVDACERAVENVTFGDGEPDLPRDREAEVVEDLQVGRIRNRDEHLGLGHEAHGECLVPARELGLEQTGRERVDLRAGQVDELGVVLARERLGEGARGDPAPPEQDLAEPAAELGLLVERRLEPVRAQLSGLDEELAEQRPLGRRVDRKGSRSFHWKVSSVRIDRGLRAVIQRVSRAQVTPGGSIGPGLCILLGVAEEDGETEADRLAAKVARLRIFENDEGKFDRSLLDVGGEALVVSQFTLIADTGKGNRPSFAGAARPEKAEPLYGRFCAAVEAEGVRVARGTFGARMEVELVNDGPVTIVIDV
jgi:D-tyrosyl-tRNA(Tyr) deacylase